jgi:DHA2 family multidrug resistance protein-like MFS transporter
MSAGRTVTVATMTRRQRWAALVILAGSLLVVMMDMTILIMALPALVADLGASADEQLWIVDIYSLFLAGLLIPMSAIADRWGRKKTLLCGFAVFGLVSILVLVADSPVFVIVLRALLGAAGAMIMPTTLSMIRTVFRDPGERAKALAIWSVISGLGMVIGPVVGGTLLEFFNWHAAFLINVPFVAVAVGAGLFLLPEAHDPNPPRWDFLAAVLSIAGMAGLVWGIKELARHGGADLASWAIIASALAVLTWFVLRCLTRSDPLIDVRLFRSRAFTAGALAALTSSFAWGALLLLVAQWLQAVEGLSPMIAGLALVPMALGSLIAAPLAPRLAIRIGARVVLAGGLAVTGVGMMLLCLVNDPLTYAGLVGPLVLVGSGAGPLAIGSAIIMGSTPSGKAGNAAAIEESMYDVGNVLGIAVLGSIAAALYRSHLDVGQFAHQGVTGQAAVEANESVVNAIGIADRTGSSGLAAAAVEAFEASLAQASLIGGIVMVAVAVIAYCLVPRSLDITTHGAED